MLFSKKKLAIKPKYRYQYGKSPILRQTYNKTLRTNGPTNFHTPRKKISLSSITSKIPKKAKKIMILLGTISILFLSIKTIFFSDYFLIKTIQISTENQDQNQIGSNLSEAIEIYKNKNILFAKKEDIIAKIQETYPEIEEIKINKDLPSTLIIEFTEYPLAANITNISNNSTKKFIINSIGYSIKENSDDPTLPYIKIKTDSPINTENIALDPQKLQYILGAISYFEEKFGMKIIESEYKVISRELHLRTEKYFYIWLDIQKPFEDQLKKLKKALVKLNIYEESLEYIDLRISGENGEKIIYKRR